MEKLRQIFAAVLRLPVSEVVDSLSPETDAAWDSVRHIELIRALEAAYGVRFATRDAIKLTSFQRVCAKLKSEGVALEP